MYQSLCLKSVKNSWDDHQKIAWSSKNTEGVGVVLCDHRGPSLSLHNYILSQGDMAALVGSNQFPTTTKKLLQQPFITPAFNLVDAKSTTS